MRTVILAGMLTGCGISAGDSDRPETDETRDTDEVVATDGCAAVSGVIRDTSGAAVSNARVNFCKADGCRSRATDATGAYTFELAPGLPCDSYAAYVVPQGSTLAVSYTIHEVEAGSSNIDIVLPALGSATPLTAVTSEIVLDGGLSLYAKQGDVQTLFGEFGDSITATVVPEADRPPGAPAAGVLAWWYLATFEGYTEDGLGMRVLGSAIGETEVGTNVQVWNAATPMAPEWRMVGFLTLGDDGYFSGDARVHDFTSLVLVRR